MIRKLILIVIIAFYMNQMCLIGSSSRKLDGRARRKRSGCGCNSCGGGGGCGGNRGWGGGWEGGDRNGGGGGGGGRSSSGLGALGLGSLGLGGLGGGGLGSLNALLGLGGLGGAGKAGGLDLLGLGGLGGGLGGLGGSGVLVDPLTGTIVDPTKTLLNALLLQPEPRERGGEISLDPAKAQLAEKVLQKLENLELAKHREEILAAEGGGPKSRPLSKKNKTVFPDQPCDDSSECVTGSECRWTGGLKSCQCIVPLINKGGRCVSWHQG